MTPLERAEEAVQWMLANARKIGQARSRLVFAERMIKVTRSLVMKKHSQLTVAAQEREADASDEMMKAILAEAEAAGEFEELRTLRAAHEAEVEMFRTLEATARQMAKDAYHGRPEHYEGRTA